MNRPPWKELSLAVVLLAGCDAEPRQLDWQVRFAATAVADASRSIDAEIRAGGCGGDAVYAVTFDVDGSSPTMPPPDLEPGTYGFFAAATDDRCRQIAEGCVEVELPRPDGEAVQVVIEATPPVPRCLPEACVDGQCVGVDAGMPPDGGFECAPGTADCNLYEGDLCEVVLGSIFHCGACNDRCQLDHATPACDTGVCVIESCDAGWANCDGLTANGCETSLRTLSDCGECGNACALPNAVEACDMGRCALVSCHEGWDDCDALEPNGCERSIQTATDCGSCDVACTGVTPLCALGGSGAGCTDLCAVGATQCGSVCVDTTSHPQHCGGCDTACDVENASAACALGSCGIGACDPAFGDCDGLAATGCEGSLTTTTDCGACGVSCAHPSGVLSCATGDCQVDACLDETTGDCDGDPVNGCEADLTSPSHCDACDVSCDASAPLCGLSSGGAVRCLSSCEMPAPDPCEGRCLDTDTDADNCGGCGLVCALPNASSVCAEGDCRVGGCADGFDDCDGVDANGCETRPVNDVDHCGACGTVCPSAANAEATCAGGACGFRCASGFGDCDGDPDNGCEQSLDTVDHCGGCGDACTLPNATARCSAGACVLDGCTAPFDDCDGLASNGCETNTNTDRSNCSVCGNRCSGGGTMSCCSGTCGSC